MVTQIAGVIEKYQGWGVAILVIAFLYTVVSKVNYIELILTRRKRTLDRLRESVYDLNTEKPVSARLALQEIHRLERIDLYGTHFYNVQNELEKISDFHSFTISDVKFMAEFSRFLKWKGSKIHFDNLELWVMRGFASVMIVAGIFLLLVSGWLSADKTHIFYTVYYGVMGLLSFLIGGIGMPPSCTKTKKAKKYISDYYNSIDTDQQ